MVNLRVVALLGTFVFGAILVPACGGQSSATSGDPPGAVDETESEALSCLPAGSCLGGGVGATECSRCCTGRCTEISGCTGAQLECCRAPGKACTTFRDCCSLKCSNGTCK